MYQFIYEQNSFLDVTSVKFLKLKNGEVLTLYLLLRKTTENMIEIVPFASHHAKAFRELNTAWLEKYFYVEEKDTALLENSKEYILDKGGYIFMAVMDGKQIGCFSLIPHTKTIYELGKMAVSENYQGKKIGQRLLEYAIAFAKQRHWEKIILYSSTKLPTALYIYKKYGFEMVELEKNLPYARSDIKMELNLNNKN